MFDFEMDREELIDRIIEINETMNEDGPEMGLASIADLLIERNECEALLVELDDQIAEQRAEQARQDRVWLEREFYADLL